MAASNTPTSHSRSASRNIPSRPTTPLRPPSRSSLRASQGTPTGASSAGVDFPLASLEPAFAELSDSMADLEANFQHLQILNESVARFNENFASFLYGMNMSAFCVDFPEAPIPQSFTRHKEVPHEPPPASPYVSRPADTEATFLTNDTSFVENPPTSSKPPSKFSNPPPSAKPRPGVPSARGSATGRGGRAGASTGTRGTGSRGRGSGIARGSSTRGRGSNLR
ncbi:hypothetical protein K431DRAFT_288200 [Polychaeton citri CBS 116435]|uniref:DASH complex subunit DAM1 n=1 Tax=Polychaeton citri CBS 116435 TaxID=1314669 RepID=A0A9P4UM10_9PEZI|nr:hypothetical protein K431DRAFT_288200 [Polychaeton citri CBS 116435]